MKLRNVVLALAAVSLLAVTAFAAQLPKPTGLVVNVGAENLECDWGPVADAAKYSVDITATATYDTGEVDGDSEAILIEVEVQASFGTSDRTDGLSMGDPSLDIPLSDIEALVGDLEYELGLLGIDIEDADVVLTAKVKALKGNGQGKQNNPFSDEVPFVLL
ncbi:MAG TPA: hypothetical protein VMW24_24185 [Sedimentisphaerales bacterium]|nr:hypothetical protein [Sedimentisphaerales bacterium]